MLFKTILNVVGIMNKLEFRVSETEGDAPVSILHVAGEIYAKNHWELDANTDELIRGGAQHILIDLTESDDMCCAGFRSLYRALLGMQRNGETTQRLKILRPAERAKRMMKTMGFDVLIPTYNNYDEAVRSFA